MTQYIVRRLLISIPLLIGISIIGFTLINLAPGDPVRAMLPPEETAQFTLQEIEAARERLGLNQPLPIRYVRWLGEALTGNLGYSYHFKRPVLEMVLRRLPATLGLMGAALSLGLAAGIGFGVISAVRRYSKLDYGLTASAFLMVSVPEFFFALLGMFVFAVILSWFPTFGMWTPGEPTGFNLDLLHHLVLPVMALSLRDIAGFMRYARSSTLDALSADFVTTARAKGLEEWVVLWKHAFRNALIPIVTIVGLSLPSLIGGSVVVESIFSWPGVGLLGYDAILGRDYPVQMGVLMILAVVVLTANLVTDVAYALVDPRIRH
ncbi:MAG: ABC transporter permease [Actinobacteria bacterium]|nr:ABC transporter permease [Actinomycetota bacterium]